MLKSLKVYFFLCLVVGLFSILLALVSSLGVVSGQTIFTKKVKPLKRKNIFFSFYCHYHHFYYCLYYCVFLFLYLTFDIFKLTALYIYKYDVCVVEINIFSFFFIMSKVNNEKTKNNTGQEKLIFI